MSILFDGDTFTHDGMSFKVEFPYDDFPRLPWEDCCGHGPVTDWTTRQKRPGELVLISDGSHRRYYDFQEACRIARKDVWGAPGDEGMKPRQKAAHAAKRDFEYLRRFCTDQWSYVGVVVTLLDNDGDEMPYSESLWGIESDAYEYLEEVAHELAGEIIAQANKTLAA